MLNYDPLEEKRREEKRREERRGEERRGHEINNKLSELLPRACLDIIRGAESSQLVTSHSRRSCCKIVDCFSKHISAGQSSPALGWWRCLQEGSWSPSVCWLQHNLLRGQGAASGFTRERITSSIRLGSRYSYHFYKKKLKTIFFNFFLRWIFATF